MRSGFRMCIVVCIYTRIHKHSPIHSPMHTHTHTHTPHSHCVVQLIIQTLPDVYVEKILKFLADRLDNSPHLEFYLHWCTKLLTTHGSRLKERSSSLMATIRDLQKSVLQKQKDLGKM